MENIIDPAVTPTPAAAPATDPAVTPAPASAPAANPVDPGVAQLQSELAEMQRQLADMTKELDSARAHARQKTSEYRKLQKASLSDPELLEELEREREEERQALEKQQQELVAASEQARREYARKSNLLDIKTELEGLPAEDRSAIAELLVDDDSKTSMSNAKLFRGVLERAMEGAVKAAVKAHLKDNATGIPAAGTAPATPAISRGEAAAKKAMERLTLRSGGKI